MIKVLFVCMGNICRSPTAEGVFRALVEQNGLSRAVYVDSAGTDSYHIGSAPDNRSIAMANQFNIDISQQRARQIEHSDFEEFDYILAMDKQNFKKLAAICPMKYQSKIQLFLDYAHNFDYEEVPDPYYTTDGFEEVFRLIEDASKGLIKKIKSVI